MKDSKEVIKDLVHAIINDDQEQAQQYIHDVVKYKMQSIVVSTEETSEIEE